MRKFRALCLTVVALALLASLAFADPIGFNGGSGWQTNNSGGNATGLPIFTGNSLTLTTSNDGEGTSAWFATAQNVGSFVASFTYTDTDPSPYGAADGVAFVIQDVGTSFLGYGGGDLGYARSPTPAQAPALVLDVFGGSWTQFEPNGQTNQSGGLSYNDTGAVNLASGNPIAVVLTYDAGTGALDELLTDTNSLATYSAAYTGVNLASLVGSSTGFIGFTGGTGGLYSNQVVSDFQYTPVPEPSTLELLFSGLALLGWVSHRRRIAPAAQM